MASWSSTTAKAVQSSDVWWHDIPRLKPYLANLLPVLELASPRRDPLTCLSILPYMPPPLRSPTLPGQWLLMAQSHSHLPEGLVVPNALSLHEEANDDCRGP